MRDLLLHCLNGHNSQGLARMVELEFHLVLPHEWQGLKHLGHLLLLFAGALAGSWITSRAARTRTSNHVECHHHRMCGLTHWTITPNPPSILSPVILVSVGDEC